MFEQFKKKPYMGWAKTPPSKEPISVTETAAFLLGKALLDDEVYGGSNNKRHPGGEYHFTHLNKQ